MKHGSISTDHRFYNASRGRYKIVHRSGGKRRRKRVKLILR